MPDLLKNLLIEFPVFAVSLGLLIVAITNARHAKGGVLIIAGAASLVLNRILEFVHFNFFGSWLFDILTDELDADYDFTILILDLIRAGIQVFLFTGLLLFAIGIFQGFAKRTENE